MSAVIIRKIHPPEHRSRRGTKSCLTTLGAVQRKTRTSTKVEEASEDESGDEDDSEYDEDRQREEAATKIQALVRGNQGRKTAKDKREGGGDDTIKFNSFATGSKGTRSVVSSAAVSEVENDSDGGGDASARTGSVARSGSFASDAGESSPAPAPAPVKKSWLSRMCTSEK